MSAVVMCFGGLELNICSDCSGSGVCVCMWMQAQEMIHFPLMNWTSPILKEESPQGIFPLLAQKQELSQTKSTGTCG